MNPVTPPSANQCTGEAEYSVLFLLVVLSIIIRCCLFIPEQINLIQHLSQPHFKANAVTHLDEFLNVQNTALANIDQHLTKETTIQMEAISQTNQQLQSAIQKYTSNSEFIEQATSMENGSTESILRTNSNQPNQQFLSKNLFDTFFTLNKNQD